MKKLILIIALFPSLLFADMKLIGRWSCEQYSEDNKVDLYNTEVYQMDGFLLEIQRYNVVGVTGPLVISVVWQWDKDKKMYTTIMRHITQIWNDKFEGTFQSYWNEVPLRTCTIRK